DFHPAARYVLRARKAPPVCLHPRRAVTGHAVLPRGKPQRQQSLLMTTRLLDQTVHETEVELTFRRFDQLPIDGDEQRVEIKRDDLRPHGSHVLETRRSGISQLAAED